jgi:hypothetical protein
MTADPGAALRLRLDHSAFEALRGRSTSTEGGRGLGERLEGEMIEPQPRSCAGPLWRDSAPE